MKRTLPAIFIGTLILFGNPLEARSTDGPRLGVFIVVDQMRGDYPSRFGPYFTGGLHRLLTEGAVFDSASHEHANTETAPGHATLSTGCFPAKHGIVGNEFYDRAHDEIVYSVEDTLTRLLRTTSAELKPGDSIGSSPQYLERTSLGNWMKQAGNSRVFSVSLKDRAAILMAGQLSDANTTPDGVYWWDRKTGDFVTSTAYAKKLSTWVDDFNRGPDKNVWQDSIWIRLLDSSKLPAYESIGTDSNVLENDGVHTTFPHYFTIERSGRGHFDAVYPTPLADQLLIRFVRELVRREQIGSGKSTDLLMFSCSAADAVGHAYGPHSQELFDYYLRLDRYFDTLFCELDTFVGRDNYVVALSSDHGVLDLPPAEQRISAKQYDHLIDSVAAALDSTKSTDTTVFILGSDIIFRQSDRTTGVAIPAFAHMMDLLSRLPYVACAYGPTVSWNECGDNTDIRRLVQSNWHSLRMPDIMVVLKESLYLTNHKTGTSHGSPWWYDRYVPLVFWGHGIKAQHLSRRVRTVDVAPTMAELLHIVAPDSLDGHSLAGAITE
jgi:predicted AlkP superfamily pyrophosphatase or phosphodiesterase